MKTMCEIIDETVEYYSNNPRSFSLNRLVCLYISKSGAKCAVGRCLIDPNEFQIQFGSCTRITLVNDLDQYLLPEYRGHSKDFWEDLQRLHDDSLNWYLTKPGLSTSGKLFVNQLKNKWVN